MDFVCITLGIASVFVIWLITILFSDCDLLLKFKARFGKKPDVLRGQVVWITGASSGIGEHLAYELAKYGCRLVLSARREAELQRVKKQCLLSGRLKDEDILILKLDVIDFQSHNKAVQDVLNHFKQIDILVNNAGRTQRSMAVETSNEVDQQIMELNVLSKLSLTKAVLPHMTQRKSGHIVVTGSVAGKLGLPFSADYSASKFALHGWFDALRIEEYENNIHVTMVCPGPVFSEVQTQAFTANVNEIYGKGMKPTENRVTTERCAELMVIAMANQMYEVWIAKNPVLFSVYLMQYSPTLARKIGCMMGMSTVTKIREAEI